MLSPSTIKRNCYRPLFEGCHCIWRIWMGLLNVSVRCCLSCEVSGTTSIVSCQSCSNQARHLLSCQSRRPKSWVESLVPGGYFRLSLLTDNEHIVFGWDSRKVTNDESASILVKALHLIASYLGSWVTVQHLPRMSTDPASWQIAFLQEGRNHQEGPENNQQGVLLVSLCSTCQREKV